MIKWIADHNLKWTVDLIDFEYPRYLQVYLGYRDDIALDILKQFNDAFPDCKMKIGAGDEDLYMDVFI